MNETHETTQTVTVGIGPLTIAEVVAVETGSQTLKDAMSKLGSAQ